MRGGSGRCCADERAQNRDDIAQAIDEALRHIPLERLVRGNLTAVKPNETWATKDDTTAVTQGVGHPAMIATGPTGRIPVETGLVIASTDPVAADCVGARPLGFTAQAARHLWEAGKLGLGETDLEEIDYPAMSFEDAAKAFTQAAYGRAITLEGA